MRRKLFCYCLLMIAGTLLIFQGIFIPKKNNHFNDSPRMMNEHGTIVDVKQRTDETYQFVIQTDKNKILASYYEPLDQPWSLIGSKISFCGTFTLPDEAGNPRTFDYRRYLLSKGITHICVIDSFSVVTVSNSAYLRLKKIILNKREDYMAALSVNETAGGILYGLLFGEKSQMDETIYESFRKNGTAHVLAVSGLHVGILYSIYRYLYEKKKIRALTAGFLLFLFVYGTAALWSSSVTRAIGLIILTLFSKVSDRRYDLLTALSAMAIFSVIKNPYILLDTGFQMSFLAVLSITFLQKPFAKHVGERWAVAFAVQAGLLPYMAYTFNYVSFVGILCNVPVIFLVSILVPVGIIGFTVFLFFDIVTPGVPQILEAITNLLIWCNSLFDADGTLSFDVISPPLWMMILTYGVAFFCASEYFHIYFYRKDWKRITIVFLIILLCSAAGAFIDRSPFDKAELVFVDVGQGDCLHVKTPGNKQLLIDGGGRYGYNVGEKILKPYLLKNRIREINLAAATHLHLDHFAGLEELAACYPVDQLLTEGTAGQKIVLEDDYWLEILWPKKRNPDTDDENENSLIFMVHHNGLKTLMTGDITAEGEAMLVEAYKGTDKLKADILKIAHHGSAYSSSDAFIKAVQPQVAVVSVGKNNYGHPSEIVIEKLEENGIMVFRTDQDGAVGIINRKGKLSVCTEKQR